MFGFGWDCRRGKSYKRKAYKLLKLRNNFACKTATHNFNYFRYSITAFELSTIASAVVTEYRVCLLTKDKWGRTKIAFVKKKKKITAAVATVHCVVVEPFYILRENKWDLDPV